LFRAFAPGSEHAVNIAKALASPEIKQQIDAATALHAPNPLPTTAGTTNFILGPAENDADAALRTVGNVTGGVAAGPLAMGAGKVIAGAGRVAGNVVSSIAPGTVGRALDKVFTEGDLASGNNAIGGLISSHLKELHENYSQARTAAAEPGINHANQIGKLTAGDKQAVRDIQGYLAQQYMGKAPFVRPEVQALIKNPETQADLNVDKEKLLQYVSDAVAGRSVKGLDLVVRKLNDVASGKDREFPAAVGTMAGNMAQNIRKIIAQNVPEYGDYVAQYARNSAPLQPFNTPLGKRVTATVNDYPGAVDKFQIDKLPDAMFQNKASFDNFRQMARDEDFVQTTARRYAAGNLGYALEGETPRAALTTLNKWIGDHEWLNPKDTPELAKNVADLQNALRTSKNIRTGALSGAATAAILDTGLSVWGLRALFSHGTQ
ncbi:MAG: hypothetical protein KGJ13_09795, partial [Patescibacteria group bacterium]|nr:hypothetical protein [Patescibacteria group bacterium]